MIRKIATNTVTRAKAERLVSLSVVIEKRRIWIRLRFREPAFGVKFLRQMEIAARVVSGKVMDTDLSLKNGR